MCAVRQECTGVPRQWQHPARGSLWLSWFQWQPGFVWGAGDARKGRRGARRMESKADPLQGGRGQQCVLIPYLSSALIMLLQMWLIQRHFRCDSQDGAGHMCNQEIPLALPSCTLCGVQALFRGNSALRLLGIWHVSHCHSYCILKPLSSPWAHEEERQPAGLVDPALARMEWW